MGSGAISNEKQTRRNHDLLRTSRDGGVSRMLPWMVATVTVLSIIYFGLVVFLVDTTGDYGNFLPPPSPEYCVDKDETKSCSRRIDLFAFQVSSGIAIYICGCYSFYQWHVRQIQQTNIPQTPAGRLFAYIPQAEWLAAINCSFQIFDFFISLLIPEHNTVLMLTHHIMASIVSWVCIQYQVLGYYGLFFLGLSEISSMFLLVVDLARYFQPVPTDTPYYEAFVTYVAQPGFVLTFVLYRFFYWWPISWQLFRDVYFVTVETDQASKILGGGRSRFWVLYIYLVMNLPLGLLQVYWLTIILQEVQKALFSA